MKKIAIFVSGNGTNCENIIHRFEGSCLAEVALVVSNRADAYALVRAEKAGVPAVVVPKSGLYDPAVICPLLQQYGIDFIVLAGFLLMVPGFLVKQFSHRMVNIHPALLPRHGGKGMYGHHVHEAVKASGDTTTGITIHWVSEVCDGGDIIAQFSTPVEPSDTLDDIAEKVHVLEMRHFPEVIEMVISKL